MAPKAPVVPAVVMPARKKFTSVIGLFTAVRSFCGLNVWKSLGKPNKTGLLPPALALTRKPVPGVLKTTPLGEFALPDLTDWYARQYLHPPVAVQLLPPRPPGNTWASS